MKDACYKKVKASYDVFPSARASQAIAKCRKGSGSVRKSDEGTSLKRWQAEKWVDTKSGKACGAGGKNEYCRPTKRDLQVRHRRPSQRSAHQNWRRRRPRRVGLVWDRGYRKFNYICSIWKTTKAKDWVTQWRNSQLPPALRK
jgi:hypothetical protein